MKRSPDAGFKLIETLVAMSILAISGVALLGAVEANVARIGALETRAAAQGVAENHLAEVSLGVGRLAPPPPMRGIGFDVVTEMSATGTPICFVCTSG